MWMTDYIKAIKRKFQTQYKFTPSRVQNGEPCFDHIPDGVYPMKLEGKTDYVTVKNNGIGCCNFKKPKKVGAG